MKLSRFEGIAVLALYLFALHLWSLPLKDNPYPFGDVDSSTHFALADYMASSNKAAYYLPKYINFSYGDEGNGKIWYPPQYHTSAAILQRTSGGDPVKTIFLFHILAATTFLLSTYLLMRSLYGVPAGLASMFLLTFSLRDIQWYLWGQYPQIMSFGLIPLALYCLYELVAAKTKKRHWVMTSLLGLVMGMQFFIHPQSLLMSVVAVGVLFCLLWWKNKKLPVKLQHLLIAAVVFVALVAPVYKFPFGSSFYKDEGNKLPFSLELNRLHIVNNWYGLKEPIGVPSGYYSFKQNHGGIWIVPLVIAGVLFCLLRRKPQDLVYLAFIIAFYVGMHDPILGLSRYERFLETEAMVLYPLAVIGVIGLISMTLNRAIRTKAIVGALMVLAIVGYSTVGVTARGNLENAYGSFLRVNAAEAEAIVWMRQNIPENSGVLIPISPQGIPIYAKTKWIQALAHTLIVRTGFWDRNLTGYDRSYLMLDMSDVVYLPEQHRQSIVGFMQQIAEQVENRSELLYNEKGVMIFRVYG